MIAVVLASTLVGAGAAQAASVAYVDGEEVWVSTLDGASKVRLSEGERDWRQVTAADSGRVLGVANKAGNIAGTSRIRLWDAQGTRISDGPLPSVVNSSQQTFPLGLDLSSDGFFLTYGYSMFFSGPNGSFFEGHYVINADTKVLSPPIGQDGPTYPTFFGSDLVTVGQNTTKIAVQAPGTGPFGGTFGLWFDTAAALPLRQRRVDVAATGTVVAFELERRDSGFPEEGTIVVVPIAGIGGALNAAAGCSLPATGMASDVSISQDARQIAWKDDQGVKVAGIPDFSGVDVCTLTSPPVVISATGSSPSIGGAALPLVRPPAPPPPPVPPKPPVPPVPKIVVTVPGTLALARLATRGGLVVPVRVARAGPVRLSLTVPARRLGRRGAAVVVATGSGRATKAQTLRVSMRLTATGRRSLARLRGTKATLTITQGSSRTTRTLTLR